MAWKLTQAGSFDAGANLNWPTVVTTPRLFCNGDVYITLCVTNDTGANTCPRIYVLNKQTLAVVAYADIDNAYDGLGVGNRTLYGFGGGYGYFAVNYAFGTSSVFVSVTVPALTLVGLSTVAATTPESKPIYVHSTGIVQQDASYVLNKYQYDWTPVTTVGLGTTVTQIGDYLVYYSVPISTGFITLYHMPTGVNTATVELDGAGAHVAKPLDTSNFSLCYSDGTNNHRSLRAISDLSTNYAIVADVLTDYVTYTNIYNVNGNDIRKYDMAKSSYATYTSSIITPSELLWVQ